MANKFKEGDIIRLISGGRTMTVNGHAVKHTASGDIPIADRYECFWMDGIKVQKAVFREEILKLA
ncbi:MAG TPA: DUF2158 domain-containing protein [Chitinophagaceae bacterium]|nr:DUF2158 domain-containing protein [Chitinophagaceae bacterium]